METINYDLSGLLTEEEQKQLFEEPDNSASDKDNKEEVEEPDNNEEIEEPIEEPDEDQEPEEVDGDDIEEEEDTVVQHKTGTSPSVYPSIARAFKKDGIFPDFDDTELDAATTPEAFAELIEKAIDSKVEARVGEKTARVDEALQNGVKPSDIRNHEATIAYLDSITEEAIEDGTDEGEALRRKLIFNDLLLRGYSEERAKRELEKSFKSETDIDDAKDALENLSSYWKNSYDNIRKEAKEKAENTKKEQKQQIEKFKKMLLEDEVKIGETKLDKKTCQRAYDAVMNASYKDPDTGAYLTEVQKYQKENPLEFMKQLGLWFTLTDGGKNLEGFTKRQVRDAKNKGIRELEKKIQGSTFHDDGSLNLVGDGTGSSDPLLSDGWNVGWSK